MYVTDDMNKYSYKSSSIANKHSISNNINYYYTTNQLKN